MVFIIFEGVYHTRMIETLADANARMVHMVHIMVGSNEEAIFHQIERLAE